MCSLLIPAHACVRLEVPYWNMKKILNSDPLSVFTRKFVLFVRWPYDACDSYIIMRTLWKSKSHVLVIIISKHISLCAHLHDLLEGWNLIILILHNSLWIAAKFSSHTKSFNDLILYRLILPFGQTLLLAHGGGQPLNKKEKVYNFFWKALMITWLCMFGIMGSFATLLAHIQKGTQNTYILGYDLSIPEFVGKHLGRGNVRLYSKKTFF